MSAEITQHLSLVDAQVKVAELDHTGEVSGGFIVVEGR